MENYTKRFRGQIKWKSLRYLFVGFEQEFEGLSDRDRLKKVMNQILKGFSEQFSKIVDFSLAENFPHRSLTMICATDKHLLER